MSRMTWAAVLVLWSAAIAGGYWKSMQDASVGSPMRASPDVWPAACTLERKADRATLLLFVHPKCPCAHATARELDRLLARHQNRLTVHAVVCHPDGATADWDQTRLVDELRSLPAVQVTADRDRTLCRAFRAATSGECFLYGLSGELLFHGGLTVARGHEGTSAGQIAISDLLLHKPTQVQESAVFGCALDTD